MPSSEGRVTKTEGASMWKLLQVFDAQKRKTLLEVS